MDIQITRGRPAFLTDTQRNDAAALLTRSGLVSDHSAISRINRAFLVLIGYLDSRPVATLSVKLPDREYVDALFERAGVKHNGESLEFGSLYAAPGSGAAFNGPKLYRAALEVVAKQGTPFYAVTRADNATMRRYLAAKLGLFSSQPFPSTRGDYSLLLWTSAPQEPITPSEVVTEVGSLYSVHNAMPAAWIGKRVVITLAE